MAKGSCAVVSLGVRVLTFCISDRLPGAAMLLVQGPSFKEGVQTESWVFVEMSSANQFKILN